MDDNDCKLPLKKSKLDLCHHSVESNITNLSNYSENKTHIKSVEEINSYTDNNDAIIGGKVVLCENNFGILQYINQSKGFSAIIKQRYSDFIVNEIDLDGDIVHFSDTSYLSSKNAEDIEIVQNDILTSVQKNNLKELETLKETSKEFLIEVEGISKADRTDIHKHIRNLFSNLDSSTETRENNQYIVVKYKHNVQQRGTRLFSGKTGEYCKFVLYKENKDTQEVINFFSKILRVKTSAFSFAGTKDRRAKTSQGLTAYKIEPNRLIGLNKRLKNVALGNFRICKNELKLGDLKGNHFTIVLRNVLGDEENIVQSINSLKESGFVNYFGMQRFGTTDVPTHHVGKALLNSNWLEAIELILKPRPNDRNEICEMRSTWAATKDAKLALKKLLHFQCVERKLLEGLAKYSIKDPLACLNCIPRNTRLMYVHAYQSYVFNRVASIRIKLHGLVVLPGDFVDGKVEEHAKSVNNRMIVTEESVGKFKITDVVLPLPGFDVEYPEYMAQYYKSILSEDNMSDFNFKHKNREYALSGCYRKLVIQPFDFLWSQTTYTDPTIPLVDSDLDQYYKKRASDKNEDVDDLGQVDSFELPSENIDRNNDFQLTEHADEISQRNNVKKALILEFSLPSSTYATMAIRELIKLDTSSVFQTSLNKL